VRDVPRRARRTRPKLYFSFRSPYSWMAIERMRRSQPDLFAQVDLYPYWDPDPVTEQAVKDQGAEFCYQQMSKPKHLYVLGDTKRLAARLGLPMAWPVDVDPWWERPHLAWVAASRDGTGERCYDALIAARWNRGENICEAEVLSRVTSGAGLDGDRLAAAAEDPDIRAEGTRGLVQAYQDDVFGVPYGYVGRQRFWGFDRMDLFLSEVVAANPAAVAADPLTGVPARIPVGAYDRDTAGGCG
jgi:2-hydroxychromene-2-carboxylate isomerase